MDATDSPDDGYLRKVYDVADPVEVRDYYDNWAETYDAELTANGYSSPLHVAQAIAGLAGDLDAPILDYGCGTGLSGEALRNAGFTTIDGADPSPEMLRVAERKDVYRTLALLDLDADRPPFENGSYAAVTAVGLIGPGAGPLSLFDHLLDLVAPGGLFGFTFNDHALDDPAYPATVRRHVDDGAATIAYEERLHHLPGLDVMATVYVLRRSTA